MNFRLTLILLVTVSISASAQIGGDFKLPKTWEKDFIITLSFEGMRGDGTSIRFTYDSCIYVNSPHNKGPKEKTYLMKEADRVAVLNKLHELKSDKIKSEHSMYPVDDGWSQTICFGSYHCIEGGTSAEMDEKNKNMFLDTYGYLEQFAMTKNKIKIN